jgi:hypothetical protein
MAITRNEFLKGGIAVAVGAVACSDDDGTTGAGGSGTTTATGQTTAPTTSTKATTTGTGTTTAPATTGGGMVTSCDEMIGANHPPAEGSHAVDIPAADVNGGAQMSYGIMGQSAHSHDITLSAADMATLAAGGEVTVTSTVELGHSHTVTVSCS